METLYHVYQNKDCIAFNKTYDELDHYRDLPDVSFEEVVYNKKDYSIQGS
jgi:hypothetical protein